MANILHLVAEAPDEQLSLYGAGALIRVEQSATQAGAYAEVGTVALVTGTTLYTFIHAAGVAGDWYKVRYSTANPTLPAHYSVYGDPFVGGVDSLICSLADARQRIGLLVSDTSQDENLLQWIGQAGDWIEQKTGRRFTPDPATGTTVYTFDGTDTPVLYIPRGIRSITTLEVAALTGSAYETVATGNYFLRPSEAERRPGWPATRIELSEYGTPYCWFPAGYDTVKVTGAFGFERVPPSIEQVALTLVVAAMRETSSSGGEQVTLNIDGSRVFERSLSYKDRQTLDLFRDWPV